MRLQNVTSYELSSNQSRTRIKWPTSEESFSNVSSLKLLDSVIWYINLQDKNINVLGSQH